MRESKFCLLKMSPMRIKITLNVIRLKTTNSKLKTILHQYANLLKLLKVDAMKIKCSTVVTMINLFISEKYHYFMSRLIMSYYLFDGTVYHLMFSL